VVVDVVVDGTVDLVGDGDGDVAVDAIASRRADGDPTRRPYSGRFGGRGGPWPCVAGHVAVAVAVADKVHVVVNDHVNVNAHVEEYGGASTDCRRSGPRGGAE